MSDRYTSFANSAAGRALVKRLGLPDPPRLRRYRPGDPLVTGPVLLGGEGRLTASVRKILTAAGVEVTGDPPAEGGERSTALLYDASALTSAAALRALYDFFHPLTRTLRPCGRVVVLGTPPEACATPAEATAQRALEGFVRSVGKEFGRGATAQLVYVSPGAESTVESTLRFLLSARSAYVSGQVIRVSVARAVGVRNGSFDWARPLAGRVALVTGAARGSGRRSPTCSPATVRTSSAWTSPAAGDALAAVANRVKGEAVQLDLTASHAPHSLAEHLAGRHNGVDVVVHNAGITRDKTLGRMSGDQWDSVLDVNLAAAERINDALLGDKLIRDGGRIIGVSSIAGIAGNRGQTNYATSKAGVIGLVQSLAPTLADRGITVNAVAPGFIETRLTARIPLLLREAGRRMNSLAQGGLPVDVAETIAWLACPASGGVTGNVVRVCGQSLIGA